MGRFMHCLSVMGHETRDDVMLANRTAAHVGFLITLACVRSLYFVVEQPQGSVLEQHPAMCSALEVAHARRSITWQGAFGHAIPKPTWLYSNYSDIAMEQTRGAKPATAPRPDGRYSSVGQTGWFSGGVLLKASEEYPAPFARALADAFAASQRL